MHRFWRPTGSEIVQMDFLMTLPEEESPAGYEERIAVREGEAIEQGVWWRRYVAFREGGCNGRVEDIPVIDYPPLYTMSPESRDKSSTLKLKK